MTEIDKLLKFDAIAEAEEISILPKEDQQKFALKLHISNGIAKEKMLKGKDTYFNMKLVEFQELLSARGFMCVLHEIGKQTTDKEYHNGDFCEIWSDGTKLLFLDSYRNAVNSANCYFQVASDKHIWHVPYSGGFENNILCAHLDAREALFHYLSKMDNYLSKWIKQDIPWFIAYWETPSQYSLQVDYDQISKDRISRLPKQLQDQFFGESK